MTSISQIAASLVDRPTVPEHATAKFDSKREALRELASLSLSARTARVVAVLQDTMRRRELKPEESHVLWLLVRKHAQMLDTPNSVMWPRNLQGLLGLAESLCAQLDLRERVAALRLYYKLSKGTVQPRLF